jgi:hypothetical protein
MRDLTHIAFSPQVVVLFLLGLILLVALVGIIWMVFLRH